MQLLANQFALGPLTLVTSFAWNYTLLNKQSELAGKLQRDGFPTLQNGVALPSLCPSSRSLFLIACIVMTSAQQERHTGFGIDLDLLRHLTDQCPSHWGCEASRYHSR